MKPLALLALVVCTVMSAAQETKLTAQDIVSRHLDSIGTPAARAAVKSRTAQAAAQFGVLIGSPAGHAQGNAMLVSLDRRVSFMMKFPGSVYPDEQFVYDGKSIQVSLAQSRHDRSFLGDFLYRQDVIMTEGLFAGVLRTSWPLLDVAARQPQLKYDGLKKVDGRELHDVIYVPKKGADRDLVIHLYFEPDTFRHVKTVYSFNVERQMQHLRDQQRGSVRSRAEDRQDTRYTVEEIFSDFRSIDGLTLPGRWKLRFTAEAGQTISTAWDFSFSIIAHNNVTE